MVMDLKFHHLSVSLLPSGALFVHNTNALVLADLHLGKGVLLQDSGVPLIAQTDDDTLKKLCPDLNFSNRNYVLYAGI